tara:strand:- start:286 stop:441 length:156 start_codon:yes stop_codon:yes gene_type:complete
VWANEDGLFLFLVLPTLSAVNFPSLFVVVRPCAPAKSDANGEVDWLEQKDC